MKLYRVAFEFEMIVLADNGADAVRVACDNAKDEFQPSEDFFSSGEITSAAGLTSDELRSLPWCDGSSSHTVGEILKAKP